MTNNIQRRILYNISTEKLNENEQKKINIYDMLIINNVIISPNNV